MHVIFFQIVGDIMNQKTHDDILESVESLKSWDQSYNEVTDKNMLYIRLFVIIGMEIWDVYRFFFIQKNCWMEILKILGVMVRI